MSLRDALRLAGEQNLDLVEVAPTAKPPVCRIMDFGKFRYEQQKRDKEVKKKQKVITLKEVKIRPNIEDHDFTVMFRGRELSHPELGKQVLVRMASLLKDMATVEREPKLEGKNMIMIVAPKPNIITQSSS